MRVHVASVCPAAVCTLVGALTFLGGVSPNQLPSVPPNDPYPSYLEGQLCGPPPIGYLPLPCGSRIVVSVAEERLLPAGNGLVGGRLLHGG